AFEDSVERAAYSGLHILKAIEKLNEDLRSRGIEFVVRIGINTGLVVVGSIGKGLGNERPQAVGAVPSVPRALQNLAEPGTVIISEATRRLVAHTLVLEDLGLKQLKGLSQPTRAFRVSETNLSASGLVQRTGDSRAMAPKEGSPLVGRHAEI